MSICSLDSLLVPIFFFFFFFELQKCRIGSFLVDGVARTIDKRT